MEKQGKEANDPDLLTDGRVYWSLEKRWATEMAAQPERNNEKEAQMSRNGN